MMPNADRSGHTRHGRA